MKADTKQQMMLYEHIKFTQLHKVIHMDTTYDFQIPIKKPSYSINQMDKYVFKNKKSVGGVAGKTGFLK